MTQPSRSPIAGRAAPEGRVPATTGAPVAGSSASVRVRVRLFAVVADRLGTRQVELVLPAGARAAKVRDELARRAPAQRGLLQLCRLAVNGHYADPEAPLRDGDEVALIPPVSGGAAGAGGPGAAGQGDGTARRGPLHGGGPEEEEGPVAKGQGGPAAEADAAVETAAPPGGRVVAGEDGRFFVTASPLSLDELFRSVTRDGHGAVVLFVGITRRFTGERETRRLEYEAYLPMAAEELARIGAEAEARWPGVRVAIGHRTGPVAIGEASVVVAAAAPHRPDAFAAARYAIDELKVRAPIWKREHYADGRVEWVGVGTAPEAAASPTAAGESGGGPGGTPGGR
ncbi:MAG TPA: molybdenum cofactor biosynthesis protein MoaE [Thermaerobacter sp.]